MKIIILTLILLSTAALLYPAAPASQAEKLGAGVKPKIAYLIRKGSMEDHVQLTALYKKVASTPGGLARTADEITPDYMHKMLNNAVHKGIIFVAEYDNAIIGSILKYRLEPRVFSHVLAEGSILVHPDFEGVGIGTKLITTFLKEVEQNHPSILRVELIVRESNHRARELYKRLGFKEEGRFEGRIIGVDGKLEADIPMAWLNPKYKHIA